MWGLRHTNGEVTLPNVAEQNQKYLQRASKAYVFASSVTEPWLSNQWRQIAAGYRELVEKNSAGTGAAANKEQSSHPSRPDDGCH